MAGQLIFISELHYQSINLNSRNVEALRCVFGLSLKILILLLICTCFFAVLFSLGFLCGSNSKVSACNAGDLGSTLGQEDLLEKGMAIHFSILAQRIRWTEESGGLQSMGWQAFLQLQQAGATIVMCGLLTAVASLILEHGLQGTWTSVVVAHSVFVAPGLSSTGSNAVVHGHSCSAAHGILLDQESNLHLLHWQADSFPLSHQGSPLWLLFRSALISTIFLNSKSISRARDTKQCCFYIFFSMQGNTYIPQHILTFELLPCPQAKPVSLFFPFRGQRIVGTAILFQGLGCFLSC